MQTCVAGESRNCAALVPAYIYCISLPRRSFCGKVAAASFPVTRIELRPLRSLLSRWLAVDPSIGQVVQAWELRGDYIGGRVRRIIPETLDEEDRLTRDALLLGRKSSSSRSMPEPITIQQVIHSQA